MLVKPDGYRSVPVAPVRTLVFGFEKIYARRVGLVSERGVQSGVIHVVALNTLVEDTSAAAKHGFAGARQVIGKADARLPGEVTVFDVALREAVDARFLNAVQIELLCAGGSERAELRRSESAIIRNRIRQRLVVSADHEVGKLVVPLKCVRQAVVTQTEVQGQPRADVPVVDPVEAVVVVDPVLAVQVLELVPVVCHAQRHVDDAVRREGVVVEGCGTVGVGLQFLVLVVVQPAHAKLELVTALGPGQIVAILEAFIAVLPRVVGGVPGCAKRRATERNRGHDRRDCNPCVIAA